MEHGKHPMLKWFVTKHLPPHLGEIVEILAIAGETVDLLLPFPSAEKAAGLRKLLEAKDCFVRARIEQQEHLDAESLGSDRPNGDIHQCDTGIR